MMPMFKLQWCFRSEISFIAPAWRLLLREACVLGAVVVVLVPAARGHHPLLGWLPLWLLAMPLLACWVAHGAPWPRRVPQGGAVRRNGLRRGEAGQGRWSRGHGRAVTTGRGRRPAACASVRGQ